MSRWVIAASATFLAAVLALLALSAVILGAIDECESSIPIVATDPLAEDAPAADGTRLSSRQIAGVAAEAGFAGDNQTVAVAVALAESGGRPDAVNTANGDGSSDHGLWQINSIHRRSGFDPSRASDPSYNAAWAYKIFSDAGNRWTPWVAYTTGTYRRHLATARRAVTGVDPPQLELEADDVDLAAACGPATSAGVDRTPSDTGPITAGELAAMSGDVGQPVPTYSILRHRDAYGDGTGGPSVNLLAPQMKIAIARLEIEMGARLEVVSGFRTADYQAWLCARPGIGRCATPGRSMHQHGLAVDVANWSQALPHLTAVGPCQPFPSDDAIHLSHVDGTEC